MGRPHDATQSAIDRLVPALERRLPALLESLNPPVSDTDLDALKREIDPYELPAEYETWLRFADGQVRQAGWWPVIDGPLLPVAQVIDFYSSGLKFQPPGLLPISYVSHYQVSIELASEEFHGLVDTTVSSVEWQVIAPSLPALIDAVTQLVESGEIDDWPDFYSSNQALPDRQAGVELFLARRRALASRTVKLLAQADWTHAPFAQGEYFVGNNGPSYWGPFPVL